MTTEIEKDLAEMPPEQADKIRAELATAMSKSELVAKCTGDPPSADEFLCITNAGTVRELIACDRSDHAAGARESCVTVADHLLPLLVAEEKRFICPCHASVFDMPRPVAMRLGWVAGMGFMVLAGLLIR